MKKFSLRLDTTKKILFAMVEGDFGPNDCNGFLEDYIDKLKKIKPTEYDLMFDCTKLGVTGKNSTDGANMTEMLKGCIELYKKDGFKEVVFDCKGNPVMGMQLNRLCRDVKLPKFQVTFK